MRRPVVALPPPRPLGVTELLADPFGDTWATSTDGPPPKRGWRRVGVIIALGCIVSGLLLGASVARFYWHSKTVGAALTRAEQRAISNPGSCTTAVPSEDGQQVEGLLQAPAIGLVAPVVDGTADPQLDVAVGHETPTPWPGQSGTMVLAAHDVTWFSQIDHLHPGDSITFSKPCKVYRYQVTSGSVVNAGTPIPASSSSTLALVTCYPLNALFFTSQRYVIHASLVAASVSSTPVPSAPVLAPVPPIDPPAALVAQGITLTTNNVRLGTLNTSGTPAPAWLQSSRPLQVESELLELYFGALHSAEQRRASWWDQLAPTVPLAQSGPLAGATIVANDLALVPTVDAIGDRVTGGTIQSEPVVAGGAAPRTYRLTMTAAVTGGQLQISGWQMQPVN